MEKIISVITSLDQRTRELIAIGASVGSNCLPCLCYHFAEAIKSGCTIQDIEEAVNLSKMVRERPAQDVNKIVEDLISKEKERKK